MWPAQGRALNQRLALLSGHILTVREDSPPGVPCAVARLHSDTAVLRHHALVLRREMLRLVRPACARCTDEVLPRVHSLLVRIMALVHRVRTTRPLHGDDACLACHTWKEYAHRLPEEGRPVLPPTLRELLDAAPPADASPRGTTAQ